MQPRYVNAANSVRTSIGGICPPAGPSQQSIITRSPVVYLPQTSCQTQPLSIIICTPAYRTSGIIQQPFHSGAEIRHARLPSTIRIPRISSAFIQPPVSSFPLVTNRLQQTDFSTSGSFQEGSVENFQTNNEELNLPNVQPIVIMPDGLLDECEEVAENNSNVTDRFLREADHMTNHRLASQKVEENAPVVGQNASTIILDADLGEDKWNFRMADKPAHEVIVLCDDAGDENEDDDVLEGNLHISDVVSLSGNPGLQTDCCLTDKDAVSDGSVCRSQNPLPQINSDVLQNNLIHAPSESAVLENSHLYLENSGDKVDVETPVSQQDSCTSSHPSLLNKDVELLSFSTTSSSLLTRESDHNVNTFQSIECDTFRKKENVVLFAPESTGIEQGLTVVSQVEKEVSRESNVTHSSHQTARKRVRKSSEQSKPKRIKHMPADLNSLLLRGSQGPPEDVTTLEPAPVVNNVPERSNSNRTKAIPVFRVCEDGSIEVRLDFVSENENETEANDNCKATGCNLKLELTKEIPNQNEIVQSLSKRLGKIEIAYVEDSQKDVASMKNRESGTMYSASVDSCSKRASYSRESLEDREITNSSVYDESIAFDESVQDSDGANFIIESTCSIDPEIFKEINETNDREMSHEMQFPNNSLDNDNSNFKNIENFISAAKSPLSQLNASENTGTTGCVENNLEASQEGFIAETLRINNDRIFSVTDVDIIRNKSSSDSVVEDPSIASTNNSNSEGIGEVESLSPAYEAACLQNDGTLFTLKSISDSSQVQKGISKYELQNQKTLLNVKSSVGSKSLDKCELSSIVSAKNLGSINEMNNTNMASESEMAEMNKEQPLSPAKETLTVDKDNLILGNSEYSEPLACADLESGLPPDVTQVSSPLAESVLPDPITEVALGYVTEPISPTYVAEPISPAYVAEPISHAYVAEPISPAYVAEPISPAYVTEPISPAYFTEPISPCQVDIISPVLENEPTTSTYEPVTELITPLNSPSKSGRFAHNVESLPSTGSVSTQVSSSSNLCHNEVASCHSVRESDLLSSCGDVFQYQDRNNEPSTNILSSCNTSSPVSMDLMSSTTIHGDHGINLLGNDSADIQVLTLDNCQKVSKPEDLQNAQNNSNEPLAKETTAPDRSPGIECNLIESDVLVSKQAQQAVSTERKTRAISLEEYKCTKMRRSKAIPIGEGELECPLNNIPSLNQNLVSDENNSCCKQGNLDDRDLERKNSMHGNSVRQLESDYTETVILNQRDPRLQSRLLIGRQDSASSKVIQSDSLKEMIVEKKDCLENRMNLETTVVQNKAEDAILRQSDKLNDGEIGTGKDIRQDPAAEEENEILTSNIMQTELASDRTDIELEKGDSNAKEVAVNERSMNNQQLNKDVDNIGIPEMVLSSGMDKVGLISASQDTEEVESDIEKKMTSLHIAPVLSLTPLTASDTVGCGNVLSVDENITVDAPERKKNSADESSNFEDVSQLGESNGRDLSTEVNDAECNESHCEMQKKQGVTMNSKKVVNCLDDWEMVGNLTVGIDETELSNDGKESGELTSDSDEFGEFVIADDLCKKTNLNLVVEEDQEQLWHLLENALASSSCYKRQIGEARFSKFKNVNSGTTCPGVQGKSSVVNCGSVKDGKDKERLKNRRTSRDRKRYVEAAEKTSGEYSQRKSHHHHRSRRHKLKSKSRSSCCDSDHSSNYCSVESSVSGSSKKSHSKDKNWTQEDEELINVARNDDDFEISTSVFGNADSFVLFLINAVKSLPLELQEYYSNVIETTLLENRNFIKNEHLYGTTTDILTEEDRQHIVKTNSSPLMAQEIQLEGILRKVMLGLEEIGSQSENIEKNQVQQDLLVLTREMLYDQMNELKCYQKSFSVYVVPEDLRLAKESGKYVSVEGSHLFLAKSTLSVEMCIKLHSYKAEIEEMEEELKDIPLDAEESIQDISRKLGILHWKRKQCLSSLNCTYAQLQQLAEKFSQDLCWFRNMGKILQSSSDSPDDQGVALIKFVNDRMKTLEEFVNVAGSLSKTSDIWMIKDKNRL